MSYHNFLAQDREYQRGETMGYAEEKLADEVVGRTQYPQSGQIQAPLDGKVPVKTTEALLAERGSQYGDFKNHARLTQSLEQFFFQHMVQFNPEGAKKITPTMKEGIHMIFHKLGRIGNGNPELVDSWDDGAGYFKLVADDLREKESF